MDIKEFNDQDEIKLLLHEIKEEKGYFQPIINPNDLEKVVAVKVKQSNSRIIKQSGSFLIFGINDEKNKPALVPEKWIVEIKKEELDFTVNHESKKEILRELDTLEINESTLFPELENQSRYLKTKYS